MDLLTRSDIEQLTERDHAGPCVSLFCPTHRFGEPVQGDPIRWRNLLTEVEAELRRLPMRAPDVATLLGPAVALQEDAPAWSYMSDGLAMFLRPGWQRMFRVPAPVPHLGVVGDRFVVGPLLRTLTLDGRFLLLALSQERVRLLDGSLQRVEPLDLRDVPTSLREVIEAPEPRSATMARPAGPAGGRGPAVFYGHGAADEHFRKGEMRRYLHEVARGIGELLAGEHLPLVLIGLDQLVSAYRAANTYPHLTDVAVRQNPDPLSDAELWAAAWPVAQRVLGAQRDRDVARFAELHGTGRASGDVVEIRDRAAHGQVQTLFLAASPWCWERAQPGPSVVRLGADPGFAGCELIDQATADTLAAGGDVYAVPEADVPGGGRVAAIFRF